MRKVLFGLALLGAVSPVLGAEFPDWVMNPEFPGGIAASECVAYSGAMSIDRQQAVAAARLALAQQIEVRVQAVDKLYVERISVGKEKPQVKTTFESASKQLTDRVLNNSRVVKVEIVNHLIKSDQLCVMVALAPQATQEYFRDIVKVVNADVPPELEKELLETFRVRSADLGKGGQSK
jgi:hypothetical protein